MSIKIHKPVNNEFQKLVDGYNELTDMYNELSDLIYQENKTVSIYSDFSNKSSLVKKKFKEFEKAYKKWSGEATTYYADPTVSDIPPKYNLEISFLHFMNVLAKMIRDADHMYNQVRLNHSNLISNIRYRKTMTTSAISMFLALLGIVLSL